jgi:hypothetical protein
MQALGGFYAAETRVGRNIPGIFRRKNAPWVWQEKTPRIAGRRINYEYT